MLFDVKTVVILGRQEKNISFLKRKSLLIEVMKSTSFID